LADAVVLDASVILAMLFNERGSEAVMLLLQRSAVSMVNLAEVHAQLVGRGAEPDSTWSQLLELGCELCAFDEEQARIAGGLAHISKRFGLSLGDRACLALAIARKATVYTTDVAWKRLELGIEVEVIR
jgi:ribonuclease VapC